MKKSASRENVAGRPQAGPEAGCGAQHAAGAQNLRHSSAGKPPRAPDHEARLDMAQAGAERARAEPQGPAQPALSRRTALSLALGGAALAACAPAETTLPGTRKPLRSEPGFENRAAPINLGPQVNIRSWTHRAGSPSHKMPHAAFTESQPRLAWAAPIGAGNDRAHRIGADPVAAGGRIHALDSRAQLSAVSPSGALLWQKSLAAPGVSPEKAIGGGLALNDGVLYATSGLDEALALDASDGRVIWRQRLGAPAHGAPTVGQGLVYLVTRDGRAWALDAQNGRIRWQIEGAGSVAGTFGGAAPALKDGKVVFALPSAQLLGAYARGGAELWRASIGGQRVGRAWAMTSDVSADPLISGGQVMAGSPSGRMASFDLQTGDARWRLREGAMGPFWAAGGALFVVTDESRLMRIDARRGSRIWAADLPRYVPARRPGKERAIYAHYGPVLAGGRLWVASSDGRLRGFDPRDGSQRADLALPAPAASRPIVVERSMYLLADNGQLLALH